MRGHRPQILFLLGSLEFGGAEKQTLMLLNRLDHRQLTPHLAYLKRVETLLPQLRTGAAGQVLCCDAAAGFDWRALRRLIRFIDTHQIELLVCVNAYTMFYGYLARLLSRTHPKLVTVFHTTILQNSGQERRMRWLYRPIFRRCDLVVYVSEHQRSYWRSRGLGACSDTVIHNGIDAEHFRNSFTARQQDELRASLGLRSGDYVIGLCAALRPEKAHGDLLEALASLRAQGLPAKALLIGDGSERTGIERRLCEMGLHDHVIITGFKPDVRPFIACCDVMALVSHSVETFSVAALESMALGKPLVMTDIGGASEQVVHGQHGFLYPPGDIPALTAHLSTLARPAARDQMGLAAAARVRQLFTADRMAVEYESRLLELCREDSLTRPASDAGR